MFRRLFLFATFVSALPDAGFAEPRLNELMAAGQSSISDEDHAHPDWLEIYNPDTEPVNLGGWHLSDRGDKPRRWTFPAVTLPPDGYLVVFASGKNRKLAAGNLHTNFSLDGAGVISLGKFGQGRLHRSRTVAKQSLALSSCNGVPFRGLAFISGWVFDVKRI